MHDKIDQLLGEKLGTYATTMRLPDGCASRLVGRVRLRRRLKYVRWTVVCLLLVVSAFSLCGFFRSPNCSAREQPMLVAGEAKHVPEVQSSWAFLGIFSECFRRTKNNKRKEDEE